MRNIAARRRLVFPVAAVLTLGLVGLPHNPGAATTVPRLTEVAEVAAVRLQAEVSSLATGMADVVDTTPPAAAASSSGAAAAATCTYPCTVFDRFLSNLPVDIRNAILPPLYAVAWVVGLVLAPVVLVTSALFGWPVSLRPAAASGPETSPAPAEATTATGDRLSSKADPGTPASVPVDTGGDGGAAAQIPTAGDGEPQGRKHRRSGATTMPVTDLESPESATPAGKDSVPVAAATGTAAQPTSTADALAPAISATEEAAPAAPRSTRPRSRSSEARPADSGQATKKAATRSAR